MNKTTIKMSVLAFLGFMTYGYAQQQQQDPYKGKVGVNTESPSATLEIQIQANNAEETATTNEGLLIPRVSKTRVANMATPEKSTLVYVNNVTYTGSDVKVSEVTKEGFYYFNGTKWVNVDNDNSLWARKTEDGVEKLYLKDVQTGDEVAYNKTNKQMLFKLGGDITEEDLKYGYNNSTIGFKLGQTPFTTLLSSDAMGKIGGGLGNSNYWFSYNVGLLKQEHLGRTGKNNNTYYGNQTRVLAKDLTSSLSFIYGINSSVDLSSNNTVNTIVGVHGITAVGSQNDTYNPTVTNNVAGNFVARNYGTSTNMFGIRNFISNFSTTSHIHGIYNRVPSQESVNGAVPAHTVERVVGVESDVTLAENGKATDRIMGIYSTATLGANATSERVQGISSYSGYHQNSTTKDAISFTSSSYIYPGASIDRAVDYYTYPVVQTGANVKEYFGYYMSSSGVEANAIGNQYGMFLQDVNKGTGRNYAIYTNGGAVRFGDNVGVGITENTLPTAKLDVNGNIKFTTPGGSYLSGKTGNGGITSAIPQEATAFHPYLRQQTSSGHAVVLGGIEDKFGLYGYKSNRTQNGFDYALVMDLTNGNIGIGGYPAYDGNGRVKEKLEVHGNIKSTSLAGTGFRQVYADADGVLRVGTTSTNALTSLWEKQGDNVKLVGREDVKIDQNGNLLASSFQGKNDATIFPDYVFQKYYTGTSSIKADYNFKSLSQVEDFVKTNGHLPGYKSAETIKAQGYVDLMETQLTNVEKIEELYLHLMEKEKEVKQLKEELKAQKEAFESRLQKLEKLIQ